MNCHDVKLKDALREDSGSSAGMLSYALESFAREIDYANQNELMKKLILEHSLIARSLELLNDRLTTSRQMLAEAQKIALLGRWDIDLAQGSITWSKSMYDILELDRSVPESSELFFSFVHPEDLEEVKRLYKEMFSPKEPWTTRYRLLLRDGKVKWVHLRFFTAQDQSGRISKLYGTIQDITEMKKVEDELERYSHQLEQLVEAKVQEVTASQMATIYALIKLSESRDDETGAHIERTASFCRLLAERARTLPEYAGEIDDHFTETIYKASPLHDIGKVGIPDSILLKPGKLTVEEFAVMKTHVQIGYETLAKVGQQYDRNEFLKMGMDIALNHHEKWDGSGYGRGLKGSSIPLSARIMALSDVYDALRSKRVYKEAFSHEKSLQIMSSSRGSHFDPLLVDIFLRHHEELMALYESIK